MKKVFYIAIVLIISGYSLNAQSVYVDHALKFSNYDLNGTARFMSMGGAFGALGGDISSIAINPAGLGVYRSSEFMFSPGLTFDQSSSTYLNTVTNDNLYRFGLSNLGFVTSYDLENTDSRWVNANFSINYNKSKDFNSNALLNGVNIFSIMEEYIYRANVENIWSPYYEELLWQTYLIDTIANYPDPVQYRSDITDTIFANPATFSINQQKAIQTEGSVGEFVFAFGANYSHKLYVGASVGLYRLNYKEFLSHYEYESSNTLNINNFDYLKIDEISQTTGTGFTFKAGAIYKPIDFIRLGLAFHLPTFYELEETFYTRVEGKTDDQGVLREESSSNKYEYSLTTPYRVNASVGFQIAKFALIDVDYEFVDYSTMKLSDKDNSRGVVEDNQFIGSFYKSTHNIRAGAEVRFNTFYVRGGFNYSTSPFTNETINEDSYSYAISGGVGYRQDNFYIDFGMKQYSNDYNYAVLSGNPDLDIANISQVKNNFALTVGFKF